MNTLITSVGRRNYIVEYFRKALSGKSKVVATNSIANSPGMLAADKSYVSPPINSGKYLEFLIHICKTEDIRLLVSLFDQDLLFLSANKATLEQIGVRVVVSAKDVIELCFDKLTYNEFSSSVQLKPIRTLTRLENAIEAVKNGELKFPLILKPRWGTGSIATEIVSSYDELRFTYKRLSRILNESYIAVTSSNMNNMILIQQKLTGVEYGLDVVNNLEGDFVTCFVKRKLGMRSGETDSAITVSSDELFDIGRRIGEKLKHIALLDADIISAQDDEFYLLDMNPRFGGGYPFSHIAGANIPAAIINWANGTKADPKWLKVRPNIMGSKGLCMFHVKAVKEEINKC